MKKLLVLFLVLVFASGCSFNVRSPDGDPTNGDPLPDPESAATIVAAWDGSFDLIDTVMESMQLSDSAVIVMEYYLADEHTWEYLNTLEIERFELFVTQTLRTQTLANGFIAHVVLEVAVTEEWEKYEDAVLIDGDSFSTISEIEFIIRRVGETVDLYVNLSGLDDVEDFPMADELALIRDLMDIHEDWLRFTYDDTLVSHVEFEMMKRVLKEMVLYQDPMLAELDDIVFAMLSGEPFHFDETDYEMLNLNMQDLFDTLFTLDLNALVAHLLDIDIDFLETKAMDVYAAAFENLLETHEAALVADGFDVTMVLNMLETDGLMAVLMDIDISDAVIFEAVVPSDFPLVPFVGSTDFLHAYILFSIDMLEDPLSMVFDFALLRDTFETMDRAALRAEAETFDFNAWGMALIEGAYLEYYDALPAGEIKALLHLMLDTVERNIEPDIGLLPLIVFEYATLLNDLDRFLPFLDMAYYGNHPSAMLDAFVTPEEHVGMTMTMQPAMIATVLETLITTEIWPWLNQLHYFDMTFELEGLVDCSPIACVFEDLSDYYTFLPDMDMIFSFDPAAPDTMYLEIDIFAFIDALGVSTSLTALDMSFSISGGTAVTPPVVFGDLNEALVDFAMFGFVTDLDEFMTDIAVSLALGLGTHAFEDIDFNGLSVWYREQVLFFDAALSTVEVTATGYIFDLYYLDGTPVFAAPVDLNDVTDLFAAFYDTNTRTDFLALVELIEEDNFTLTRLLLFMILKEDFQGSEDPEEY